MDVLKIVWINGNDSWDFKSANNGFEILDKSIRCTDTKGNSTYLTNVIKGGINIWDFKIDYTTSGWQLLGIWETKYKPIHNQHFTQGAQTLFICNRSR